MTKRPLSHLKFISLKRSDFIIHPKAKNAYQVWLKLAKNLPYVDARKINKYYKPVIRVIQKDTSQFYYFDSFKRIAEIQKFEAKEQHQFVITYESEFDICKMAWAEVLELSVFKDTNHQLLWEEIKQHCAHNILKELMQCEKLRIEDYCVFANISVDHYEYKQRSRVLINEEIGLPQNLDWVEDDD